MMMDLGDHTGFIRNISQELEKLGIGRDELVMMDHLCYRVATNERYDKVRTELSKGANLVGENNVNGRIIAVFELEEYIYVDGWVVPYIELPQPKEGSPYAEGLEHAELVVAGSLERFLGRHSNLPFSRKGMDKTINPEAGLKTEDISVKFHEQQLGAVVRIENRLVQSGE